MIHETACDETRDCRYPRQIRLLHSQDFQTVFTQTECKSSDRFFTLLARRNNFAYPRLGLAITKKKIKTAVARHSIKRVVRESYRLNKQLLAGLDIVVLGSTVAGQTGNQILFEHLQRQWQGLARRCAACP